MYSTKILFLQEGLTGLKRGQCIKNILYYGDLNVCHFFSLLIVRLLTFVFFFFTHEETRKRKGVKCIEDFIESERYLVWAYCIIRLSSPLSQVDKIKSSFRQSDKT